jgi:hypothetical protein
LRAAIEKLPAPGRAVSRHDAQGGSEPRW